MPRTLFPAELARCRAELLSRRIVQEARRSDVAEARENCRSRRALYSAQLVSAMRMGKPLRQPLPCYFCRALIFCLPFLLSARCDEIARWIGTPIGSEHRPKKGLYSTVDSFKSSVVLCPFPTLFGVVSVGLYLCLSSAHLPAIISRTALPPSGRFRCLLVGGVMHMVSPSIRL